MVILVFRPSEGGGRLPVDAESHLMIRFQIMCLSYSAFFMCVFWIVRNFLVVGVWAAWKVDSSCRIFHISSSALFHISAMDGQSISLWLVLDDARREQFAHVDMSGPR